MRPTVHDTLASAFDSYSIVRQLHDVPPHEVYEVSVDGHHAVVKGDTGSTGNAATEGTVIAFLGEGTALPVPQILLVGDDHYVAAWDPDAPPATERTEVDERWAFVAGRGIATLHVETDRLIGRYGAFQPVAGELSSTGEIDWHTAAIAYIRRHRSVPDEHGHADIVDTVIDSLTDRPDLFEGAGNPVCCHGWATPEHVAVTNDHVSCMVDFEHAIAAPGEFDYWRTVLPTFHHEPPALQRAFRNGYESLRSLPAGFEQRKSLYVLLNLIYYIESLYVQDQHGPVETARRAEWFRDGIIETIASLS